MVIAIHDLVGRLWIMYVDNLQYRHVVEDALHVAGEPSYITLSFLSLSSTRGYS